MQDVRSDARGANQWSVLLEETRLALSSLRAEDLEDLAARAECLLAATLGPGAIRQRIPQPDRHDLVQMRRQHRALGDLLHATDANLAILSRTRARAAAGSRVREGNSRWAR